MSGGASFSAAGPVGLLLSRDLIFTSKVTGTARELGQRVFVAGSAEVASELIATRRPRVVFIDLAAGDLVLPDSLRTLKARAGPEACFVAFGSHVDKASLDAASAAGCDVVMPRSRFTQELPELIRRHLGDTDAAP